MYFFRTILAILCYLSFTNAIEYKVTDQVFFVVRAGKKDFGKITIGLFGSIAPKTVQNFLTIASDGIEGKSYKGSSFHRVIERFMIQGGDILYSNGSGAISKYGKSFNDETFEVKHSGPGFVSMANSGPNTNGCQFFITTIATPWLDGQHVAFGKVVDGQDVVHRIEHVQTDSNNAPVEKVLIVDSGIIPTPKPFSVSDQPYDAKAWLKASAVPLGFSFAILCFFHWAIKKLDTV